jgi:hypothetical protein
MNKYSPFALAAFWISMSAAIVFLTGCSGAESTIVQTSPPPVNNMTPTASVPTIIPMVTSRPTFVLVGTPILAETVIEVMKPTPSNPYITDLVQQARHDLAAYLNVPVEEIVFLNFEAVTWPDGSLGCPSPGVSFTQVTVEGYRILLHYAGQDYAYHGGGGRAPFLCQNPQK